MNDMKSDSAVQDKLENKLEQLDQKWSERLSRLEAMLLSKTFTQPEPAVQPIVVT